MPIQKPSRDSSRPMGRRIDGRADGRSAAGLNRGSLSGSNIWSGQRRITCDMRCSRGWATTRTYRKPSVETTGIANRFTLNARNSLKQRRGSSTLPGIDVFDVEPPPADRPFRTMDNATVTPHLGYVTLETLRAFYTDTLEALVAFADGAPIRVANPDALAHAKHRTRAARSGANAILRRSSIWQG